nr:HNH/ENDO VII family nuclease [Polycladospora coralii]
MKVFTHNMWAIYRNADGRFAPAPGSTSTNNIFNNRPAYARGQVEYVWQSAKDQNGRVFDSNTGQELFWDKTKARKGQWDMGHIPGQKYSDMRDAYGKGLLTADEFRAWYRNPNNYIPESISGNRSHRYE